MTKAGFSLDKMACLVIRLTEKTVLGSLVSKVLGLVSKVLPPGLTN